MGISRRYHASLATFFGLSSRYRSSKPQSPPVQLFFLLMNDDFARSEDGFDALCETLPQVNRLYRPEEHRPKSWREEKFQNWLVSRFDRTGQTTLWNLISVSFSPVWSHLVVCCCAYVASLAVSGFLFAAGSLFLGVVSSTIASLVSISMMLSFRTRSPFVSVVLRIFTKSGLVLVFGAFVMISLRVGLVLGITARSSSASFFLVVGFACEFVFFFVPSLVLDEGRLSPSQVLYFSFRIATTSSALVLEVLLLAELFVLISPLTLGVTYFLSHSLRLNLFLTRCGAASPPRA